MRRKTTTVTKNRYLTKICPFTDCHKVLSGGTLPRHLVLVHHLSKGSEEQKKMLSVAKCYIEPPKNSQVCSPKKECGINQKERFNPLTPVVDTVEENHVEIEGLLPYVEDEQEDVFVYDTRKNRPVGPYHVDSDTGSDAEELFRSDDDYHPISDDEDFDEDMLHILAEFDKYMKGPDRRVKGSSLYNTIGNVRRIFFR